MTAAGEASPWADAALAATLFAIDPVGLGGVAVHAGAGPVRDAWMALLRDLLPDAMPVRRLPLAVADGRLLGGLDLAATLKAGRPVAEKGLLAEADGGVVVLAMAERVPAGTAAKLTAAQDAGEVVLERDGLALRLTARFGVVALDEGIAEDERVAPALLDRQAFHLDLSPIRAKDAAGGPFDASAVAAARARLSAVDASDEALEALVGTAMAFGIDSLRAPMLALKAARAHAALAGRDAIVREDIAAAARLVYASRATMIPTNEPPPEEAPPPPPPEDGDSQDTGDSQPDERTLDDIVVAAVAAAIPPGLLLALKAAAGRVRARAAGRVGAVQQAKRRGRPIGARKGEPRSGHRLNIVETLRAAAPWQRIRQRERERLAPPPFPSPARGGGRGATRAPKPRVEVRKDDFRVTRYKQRAQSTTIFVVDASGSTALHRLSEAKGAVELLLADCYVRRDQVALIAFRGKGADLLLPPTRSLFRAKRCLEALPGGGGTPLAAALEAAAGLADAVRRRGQTPTIVLLTDGRANIARDGAPGRPKAEEDALSAARMVRGGSFTTLVVDNSPRPEPRAQRLAEAMGALYIALPMADATSLSKAVMATLPAGA